MTNAEKYAALAEKYFTALTTQNIEDWVACQTPDTVYNVNGMTPVSGRTRLPELLETIFPKIFGALNPDKSRIGVNWKIMCADDRRCVVMFEGDCETTDGRPYRNRYCQMWEVNADGRIQEVWEFFDTALANECLFGDAKQDPDYPKFQY